MKNKKKIIFLGILIALLLIVIYIFSSRYYLYKKANSYKMLSNEEINIISEENRTFKESDTVITVGKVSADFQTLFNEDIECNETEEMLDSLQTYCKSENYRVYINEVNHVQGADEIIKTDLFDVNGINSFFGKVTESDIDNYIKNNDLIDFIDVYYHVLKDNYKSVDNIMDLEEIKNTLIFNVVKDTLYPNPKETYFITYNDLNVLYNKAPNDALEITIEKDKEYFTIIINANELDTEKLLEFFDSIQIN